MKQLNDYMLDPPDQGPDPHCPSCGQECDTVYYSIETGMCVGCDVCLESKSAWECEDCFLPDSEE